MNIKQTWKKLVSCKGEELLIDYGEMSRVGRERERGWDKLDYRWVKESRRDPERCERERKRKRKRNLFSCVQKGERERESELVSFRVLREGELVPFRGEGIGRERFSPRTFENYKCS